MLTKYSTPYGVLMDPNGDGWKAKRLGRVAQGGQRAGRSGRRRRNGAFSGGDRADLHSKILEP